MITGRKDTGKVTLRRDELKQRYAKISMYHES
jgi:hypothetical protein